MSERLRRTGNLRVARLAIRVSGRDAAPTSTRYRAAVELADEVDAPMINRPPQESFSSETSEQVADVMFALSTPSRVQILVCLAGGAHSVSDLVERLGLEQSAISHQLRVLRDHSLVRVERHGRRRVYRLYDEHVLALLNEAIRHVEERRGIRRGDARSSVLAHVPLAADQ